jgi:hypothetical protein
MTADKRALAYLTWLDWHLRALITNASAWDLSTTMRTR